MIHLSVLARTLAIKINDQATTEIVLNLDHVACHLAGLPSDQVLGQLAELGLVREGALVGLGKHLSCSLFSGLLTEADSEDMILD